MALSLLWLGPAWGQPTGDWRITNLTHSADGPTLSWTSAGTGFAYTIEARDTLTGGLWLPLASDRPWPIGENQWSDPRPTAAARFYRVAAVPAATRGKLLSSSSRYALSVFQINLLLGSQGVTGQYAVQIYKLVYETIDAHGGRTLASGALVVPQNPPKAVPLVSYQHGTLTLKTDAPSANLYGETMIGVALATTGYVVTLPDYLGLGDSSGIHPYHHATSEATASVDMLRAARAFCANNRVALNEQLFLCGYSQGGHATMALHRELEAFHTNEFSITAAAPMAGAYDLAGVATDDFLSGRPMPNPFYFVYLLAAYQEVYRVAGSLGEMLAEPYRTTLPPLLDGQHSSGQINAALPANPMQVLKPAVLADFVRYPDHPLRLALRDNDLYRWAPRAPLHLYHCAGDQDVLYANSVVATNGFVSRGATQVQLIDRYPAGDHGDCVMPSLLDARAWFDSLKR